MAPAREGSRLGRVANAGRWVAFVLSLAVLCAALLAFVHEKSGGLTERVRAELSRALGLEVEIERVEVAWLQPSARIAGVRLAGSPSPLVLERVDVDLAWRNGRLAVERVDVLGGRIELSDALIERFEAARRSGPPTGPPTGPAAPAPLVVVRDLAVDWMDEEWGRVPIGTADGLFRDSDGLPEVRGRVAPAFAASEDGPAPEIYFAGRRGADGRISFRASAERLPITSRLVPERAPYSFAQWQPRAELTFELESTFGLDETAPPAGRLRASLAEGSLHPPAAADPLTAISVELEASGAAPTVAGLLDPGSWTSIASVSARWRDLPLQAWALLGTNAGPGLSARAWLRAPQLPLSREALEASGLAERVGDSWPALEPRGRVDVLCGLKWPTAASLADEEAALTPEITVDADLGGTTGVTFHGWPRELDGKREGFPLPVESLQGRVIALHRPRRASGGAPPETMVAMLQVLGAHSRGTREEQPAFIEGLLFDPPGAPEGGPRRPLFDLRIGGHGIPVDGALREAFGGLEGTDFIWDEFSPEGGSLSVAVRLVREPHHRVPASRVSVELFGVDGRWREIPVPLDDVRGRIEFLGDPRLVHGVAFDLACRTPLGARVHAAGRVQDDPGAPPGAPGERALEVISLEADGLLLKGGDRDAIVGALPEVGTAIDPFRPQGRVSLDYRSTTERSGGPRRWRVEVRPEEVVLTPSEFPIRTYDLRGRVLVDGEIPAPGETAHARTRTRIAPLSGAWLPGTVIAARADLPSGGDGHVEVFAAGMDLSNSSLAGAFRDTMSKGLQTGHRGLGLSALNVDGRVDFNGEFTLPSELPRAPESVYRVHLRENDVKTNVGGARFALDGLVGVLEQEAGVLTGEQVTATLAGTGIVLRNARFQERGGLYLLETSIEALEMPIDREHLIAFLDEDTISALVDQLGWRGTVDVRDASLVLSGDPTGEGGEARFSGNVTPREMEVDFGVPVLVHSAAVRVDELVYRRKSVSATAAVSDLRGRVADRRLEKASFRLDYAEPRLSIHELAGDLEGGRFSGIEGAREPRPAFSIALSAPFPFDLAAALEGADVGGLLRGLFESDFASKGRLTSRLVLEGDLERLTAIKGRGRLSMRNTTLWSIPVVRDLLSQFNLDSTAVFESIESDLEIADGKVELEDLKISSPLLKLVGDGSVDFDGTLRQDFEVRYALLDHLGWFNRLFYAIQKTIIRVAIRGDMGRPRVELQGLFGRIRGNRPRGRELPLPSLAPLPERF